jgi:uncharacterized membrane protein
MPNLHPFVVHFPITLLTAAFVADIIFLVKKKDGAERTGWWLLGTGYTALVVAVISGLMAEGSVNISGSAAETFERHEQLAFAVAVSFGAVLLWRFGSRTRIPTAGRAFYITLHTLAVCLLWLGAWYGGRLVFEFGVGVAGN